MSVEVIATAALDVLTAEMVYTATLVLRSPAAPVALVNLQTAQAAYEAAILTRTTPVGAVS